MAYIKSGGPLRKAPELENAGLEGETLEHFCHLVDHTTEGVILLSGPAGSGKTTTLRTILRRLRRKETRLVSLESLGDRYAGGGGQASPSFAGTLRAALRQKPDIITIDELWDSETAELALQAGSEGCLVLAVLRSNGVEDAIKRLLALGVRPGSAAGALNGVISQRLPRRVCPYCRKAYTPTLAEEFSLGLPPGDYLFYQGTGCGECFGTGYQDRTGVFEVLSITPAIRRAIGGQTPTALETAIRMSNFRPIAESCRKLLLSGAISGEEAHRVLDKETAGGSQ